MRNIKWKTFGQKIKLHASNNQGNKYPIETHRFIRPITANLTDFNITNISSTFINSSRKDETENVSLTMVSYIITIIVNSITCPFTVLLNVLVIMAVKRRPRLQTNTNILLACLAATDALTGLITQPLFILWKTFYFIGVNDNKLSRYYYGNAIRILSICSRLHLMLVTFERLIAIKFTMRCENIISNRNIKVAVILCWMFSITGSISNFVIALVVISCIVFVASSYFILFLETRRHQKMIKTQQMPQDEVERFCKENKALKTTVYVVGALLLCFSPMGITFVYYVLKVPVIFSPPWVRTFAMSNSLLNPLIYCWRQKEMRKFVFRKRTQAVQPAH